MPCFEMRAVQIDLARQIETVEMVKRFFDEAADSGMNTVFMYLEDRIKTATYPYSPDEESYSPDQIREMVAYADGLGLELVPVVSPIGHTERFLRHPEMKHLAELRGKIAGAFNKAGEERYLATCPKLPENLAFFDAYITEVASLFPSKYFHIGFDEIWDMGFCELCKGTKVEDLFLGAIGHFHDLLKSLGKETMIWDDMIENFPWALEKLPRDIVVCAWFYQFVEQYPIARFSTSRSYDVFGELERLGFRYLGCPWLRGSIDSVTTYASKHHPMGMLLTNWEMTDHQQIPYLFPVIRYAGSLWSGREVPSPEARVKAAAAYTDTPEAARALATAMSAISFSWVAPATKATVYHVGAERAYETEAALHLVETLLGNATGDADVLDAWHVKLHHLSLRYRLWRTGYALHEYRAGNGALTIEQIREQAEECRRKAAAVRAETVELWNRCRPSLAAPQMESIVEALEKSAAWLAETAATATTADIGRLVVRFDLPEFTAACKTGITLHYADGTTYEAGGGTYKGMFERTQKYSRSFEIPASPAPVAITLTVSGYGASGFRYLTVELPDHKVYVPDGVVKVSGQVEHPEFMLADDDRAAVFNEQEMLQFFVNDISRLKENSVTLSLKAW